MNRLTLRVAIGLLGLLTHAVWAASGEVEVVLIDMLDEPRGFCIDILGFKQKAQPERGLQTHSCYSYQGEIAVDQAFDAARLKTGEFHMSAWNVCMTVPAPRAGVKLALQSCDGRPEQRFDFTPTGEIVSKANSQLCVTVGSGASIPGGGGKPVHLIRSLSVETCAPARAMYQKWRVREKAD